MGLMQSNGGVHMGTDTVAVAATRGERVSSVHNVDFNLALIYWVQVVFLTDPVLSLYKKSRKTV